MHAPGMLVTPNVRLTRPLQQGGMGEVWLAEHLGLRTHVVVKFLGAGIARDAQGLARFQREAAAASHVKSPHVVQTFDFGVTQSGDAYIVMEHLEGSDLSTVLKGRALPLEEVAKIVYGVARALQKAHERGIVHRDIKPANVFLCDVGGADPFVKVLDFGIAKGLDEDNPLTRTGDVVGTPSYMSPEQLNGDRNVDHRTDLWSLGVLAYRAAVGVAPFRGDGVASVALAVVSAPIPVPSQHRPGLPPAFDQWFARACSRDRSQRWSSAAALSDALCFAVTGQVPAAQASWSGGFPVLSPAVGADQTGRTRGSSVLSIVGEKPRSRMRPLAIAVAGAGLVGSLALAFVFGRSTGPSNATQSSQTESVRDAVTTVEGVPEAVVQTQQPVASAPASAATTAPVASTLAIPSATTAMTSATTLATPPIRPKTTARPPRPNPDDLGF